MVQTPGSCNSPSGSALCPAGRRLSRLGNRPMPIALVLIALVPMVACQFPSHAPTNGGKVIMGAQAPDFALRDAQQVQGADPVTLSLLIHKGPVVIIFHRGLHCPICVQHLGGISADINAFKMAGIQVIAISPDTAAETRDAIESYGAFPFPLLSDRDDKVARAFGLAAPDGSYLHGAFVIDRECRIQFAKKSDEPIGEVSELLNAGIGGNHPR